MTSRYTLPHHTQRGVDLSQTVHAVRDGVIVEVITQRQFFLRGVFLGEECYFAEKISKKKILFRYRLVMTFTIHYRLYVVLTLWNHGSRSMVRYV